MLKWPDKGLKALVKLFEPLQDIDIYVEDVRDEIFYTRLLKRVAGSEVRIARVFSPPVKGGRKTVMDAAEAHDHNVRRALFLIDGDLAFARGEPPPQGIRGLYRLEAYCIENFLLCPDAAAKILMEEAIISPEDAEARLDFANWYRQIQPPLVSLFSAFALINGVLPSYPTVSLGVGVYCHQVDGATELSAAKIEMAVNSIQTLAENHVPPEQVAQRIADVCSRAEGMSTALAIVSGKDFLLPLLAFRLSSLGCKLSRDRLRFRLALHCDTEKLRPLLSAMKAVARGQ